MSSAAAANAPADDTRPQCLLSQNLLSHSRLIPYADPRVQMALHPQKSSPAPSKDSTANLGFEAKLWLTADKLRNNMDAAEYKHVVLGLIFLKYISDAFEEHRAKLLAGKGDYVGANAEDSDEYKAENVFWVPKEGRWSHLQASAKQPTIGKIVDDAMVAIERDNPRLKGVLPKDYARPGLDKHRLGELIDLIGTILLTAASEGASQPTMATAAASAATVASRRPPRWRSQTMAPTSPSAAAQRSIGNRGAK